jgi:hypothetical protein
MASHCNPNTEGDVFLPFMKGRLKFRYSGDSTSL